MVLSTQIKTKSTTILKETRFAQLSSENEWTLAIYYIQKKVAFEFVGVYPEKGGFTYIYGKYHQRDEQCDFRNIKEEFVILRVSKMIFFKCESDTSLKIWGPSKG